MCKIRKSVKVVSIFLLLVCSTINAQSFSKFNYKQNDVRVFTENNILTVKNNYIERKWKLTEYGLVTMSIKNIGTNKIWQNDQSGIVCDWSYNGLMDGKQKAKLISLKAMKDDDEGFADEHTEIVVEFTYPESKVFLKYLIWIYPETQGIRTQSYIKGDVAGSVIVNKQSQPVTSPAIRLRTGNNFKSYETSNFAPLWDASYTFHPKSVEYQVSNLNKTKKYKIGVSWWNFDGESRKQQVRLTSVDGEADITVVEPQLLPDFKQDNSKPAEFLVNVPDGVYADGSFRLFVDNLNNAKNAAINEIWLYEEGNNNSESMSGEDARLVQLMTKAPSGYILSSYFDCGEKNPDEVFTVSGNVDFIPLDTTKSKRIYIGYFNDTQHRNSSHTPILKEETHSEDIQNKEQNWWANIVALEQGDDGVMMVKESHKCVNQYGVETGSFIVNSDGICNTGTSLSLEEIVPDKYKWFWGSWVIPYQSGDVNRQLALKSFDRKRFPARTDRDMYSLVCTWGHSKNPRDGRNYATESEVLREMDNVKEINVDLLLIDDGWQISLDAKRPAPDEGQGWKPAPSVYPDGWRNVKRKADSLGLKLGLWGVAQEMPAQNMIWNWEQIRINQVKLDFANFETHDMLSNMMDSVRLFLKAVDHKSSVSWDLTENKARYGYYWAREYGNLHFMNRKPFFPMNVLYVPHLALRDFWLLARYNNLNKYQLVIQHAKATEHASDAYKHPETYCVATALMGIPEFMAMPRFYQPEDRKEVAQLMKIYKSAQKDIFTGFVFPIGNEPNNKNWSGFQSINNRADKSGYLTVFRELLNMENKQHISLFFVSPGQKIEIINLRTNEKTVQIVGNNSDLKFVIDNPADFLFLKWKIL